jgi:hypothetical protein
VASGLPAKHTPVGVVASYDDKVRVLGDDTGGFKADTVDGCASD